jgi:hydrogenase maturation factor
MRSDIQLAPQCDHESGCITCGDEGIAVRVLSVDQARELALCAGDDGKRTTVEIALVGEVAPGDGLLVHAGTALARLDPTEAGV